MGFFGPNNYGTGITSSGSGGQVTINIDPPIDSGMSSKVQLAFGFDQLIAGYSGNTCRLKRTSDNAESDFGLDATGRFNLASAVSWAGGSNATLVKFYDQAGTGEEHTYATQPTFLTAGVADRFGTAWSSTDGQLTRSNSNGGVGVNYVSASSIYGETTTSGITTASGLEFHILCSFNNRKINPADVTDPAALSGSNTAEALFSYYTSSTNFIYERICSGTALFFGVRNGTGDGGSSQNLTNNTANSAVGNVLLDIKKYSTYVGTVTNTDTTMDRYHIGAKPMAQTTSAGNVTANAAMTNGTFRTGRREATNTSYPNYLFGGIIVTDSLTDFERYKLQSRLYAIAHQHKLMTVSDMVDLFDEWVDFRDINAGTGQVVGKNGLLTLNFNTGGTPQWDFAYTTPVLGIQGLRSIDGTDTDNYFSASNNYFYDAREASVFCFGRPEIADIFDWWVMHDGSTNQADTGDLPFGLGMGRDHYAPRLMTGVDNSLDTNDFTNGYGYNDNCGGNKSQAMIKYGNKLTTSDWLNAANSTVDTTLNANYGSLFIPSGTNVDNTFVDTNTGIKPPTPEYDQLWDVLDFEPAKVANVPMWSLATVTPNPSYDYNGTQAAREPFLKKATNWLYVSTGVGLMPGHHDASIAKAPGSGNHIHMTSSYKIRASKYQGRVFQGTAFIWAFVKNALTQEEAEKVFVNLYKVYTDGY